ncbi:DNA-binding protein [Streptomyces sp. NPDC004435]|uniref:DNA-binding protein n=1 Tax=Streptomyces sp. NPDC004435 TaxID=3364701 RepID=UPI0036BA8477
MTGTTATNDIELLNAGAVLPADTVGAGPSAVELTARTYRHPVFGDDRVVVRLTAAELGAAEDLAAGFLGLEPAAEPAVVGLGRRQELGFPEWVLVHHPEDGHHALAVVPELDRLARQAKSKPKAALDACLELAGRLASSVPHFLPVFFEQAARVFLAVENTTYAGQLFGRARTSEAQHGLPVDEDRLDAVFLEFALAGALPVKVLSGYGKELSARLAPQEAYERFRRLCVRRTAGGLAPSAQAATELRRLARAAGLSAGEAEQDHLAELLPLPATLRAATGWWKAHRAPLVALARRVPGTRGTLLTLAPSSDDGALSELWLDILTESGADTGLVDAGLPAEEQCADGAAGWLERFHAARHSGWGRRPTPTPLLDLVERAAGRIRADLAARPEGRRELRIGLEDTNLLDLLLALDVPVRAPERDERRHGVALDLTDWHQSERPRDLAALAADPRFHRPFDRGANAFNGGGHGEDVLRRLAASEGGRVLLARWTREVARSSVAAGLPGLPAALSTLAWLPAEALALAPEEVAAAAGADLGETLARTLRGGLWEEFHWPEWERAVAELAPASSDPSDLTVVEAWPHLIVANASQARVIGADATLLVHDLRIPTASASSIRSHGFHYVDGALLVFWTEYGNNPPRGYWHTAPDRVFTLEGNVNTWSLRSGRASLELPGGGRTTGRGVLHAGDTRLPAEVPVISDGTSYWAYENRDGQDESGWVEYDPVEGTSGRRSQPGFLADALRPHAPGARLGDFSSWLRPAPTVEDSAVGAPVHGLLGWRVVRLPENGWHAGDLAGREVVLPEGSDMPLAALTFPGDARPRALTREWRTLSLTDPEGVVTATCEGGRGELFRTATSLLPPLDFLYALRTRDPRGSAVLRAADAETAGALLKGAVAAERAEDVTVLVGTVLPGLSPELAAGVTKVLRFAVRQQKALDAVAARLDPADEPVASRVAGPADRILSQALNGVVASGYSRWGADSDVTHHYLEQLAAVRAATDAPAVPGRLHFDLPTLPWSGLPFTPLLDTPAVLAYRAVAPCTEPARRDALLGVLGRADALGLLSAAGSAGHWRRVLLHLTDQHLTAPDGQDRNVSHRSVVPLGGGAALGFTERSDSVPGGRDLGALLYDPSGRFEVPGPYTVRACVPVGDPERAAGWASAFLREAEARGGAAPFLPAAAEEFGRLTGASRALAGLVLAGMPEIDSHENNFLPLELRKTLGVKVVEAAHARNELRALPVEVRQAVVSALLPDDPARLWTEGPDVAAAAEVWNARVGRRAQVPDWLTAEAARAVRGGWPAPRALAGLLDPANSPELGVDVAWHISNDKPAPVVPVEAPFTGAVLTGAVGLMGWLAHRLPAGDPLRAALPGALTAVRQRLASPDLLVAVGHYTSLAEFRKVAGAPTETAPDHERYGAVLMATYDGQPLPALRTALLDSTGADPYLPALRGEDQRPTSVEAALRLCHDPAFARLLADPGAPAAGGAADDGTWWPQDPSRSVPSLVAEAAAAHGLGADAATLYLMLLALPDPTDRNTARWTGWKPARLKAARAELAATDLVVSAVRARAGRSLFLPGAWAEQSAPVPPVEQWKSALYGLPAGGRPVLGVLVPAEPVAELYARAWRRIVDGDLPRFEELKVKRTRRRR